MGDWSATVRWWLAGDRDDLHQFLWREPRRRAGTRLVLQNASYQLCLLFFLDGLLLSREKAVLVCGPSVSPSCGTTTMLLFNRKKQSRLVTSAALIYIAADGWC